MGPPDSGYSTAPPASRRWAVRWAVGSAVMVGAVLSQYVVPVSSPIVRAIYGNLGGDLLIVYGIPIGVFAVLVGAEPLRAWAVRVRLATQLGLGWLAGLSLLALGISIVMVIVYAAIDPAALGLLSKPNPELRSAAQNPWLYVGLSFLVGACEETIFRGWFFGTWVRRSGHWLLPAFVTSAVFAAVHLYYGLTYGVVSPIYYQQLFLVGFAFAATYHGSGGNLLLPAFLHGLNDAISFLSVVSVTAAVAAHYLFLAGAGIVGLLYVAGRPSGDGTPPAPAPPG